MIGIGCMVVFYHYVRDVARTEFPDIKALPPSAFAAQLAWLQTRFDVIDSARRGQEDIRWISLAQGCRVGWYKFERSDYM